MRRVLLGILAAMTLAACDLPFASTPAPAPTPTDISPADAMKLVNDFWTAREAAFGKVDGNGLDATEGGDLVKIDRSVVELRTKLKLPGEPSARQLTNVKVFAPHQKDFPAQFLAMGDAPALGGNFKPTSDPVTNLFIFTKQDSGSPFKAVMLSIKDPAQTLPELNVDKDGFAALVEAVGQAADYKIASGQVAPSFSDFLNQLKQGQTPSTNVFAAGAYTTQAGSANKDAIAAVARVGVKLNVDFSGSATTANYAYQTKDGDALDLFVVSASVSAIPAAGSGGFCLLFVPIGTIAQGIAPGAYRVLAYTSIGMGAAVVPKTADKDKLVTVPALGGGPEDVNASPC